jgi:DNA primase large subunit
MTAATKKAPAPKPAEKTVLEYLQHALEDLARAREQAQQEARAGIDSAVERIRGVRKDVGARAHEEADDLQARLEHASDEALKEFGRAAIRAQRTPEALTEMQTEIRHRKRTLLV